jgi:membrane-anchored glycerophosphoryl diester phosphodiesterase (GDPDase)
MYLISIPAIILHSVMLASTYETLAYLDPGSGSLLIQLIIAVLVGGLVFLKSYWSKIRSFFSKATKKNTSVSTENLQDSRD